MSNKMKFREDGTFVIVQFSDVEFIDAGDYDPDTPEFNRMTRATMESVIKQEKPDLIVFAVMLQLAPEEMIRFNPYAMLSR